MEFLTAVRTCLVKYFDFKGRAARPEFWYWMLFNVIGTVVVMIILPPTSVGEMGVMVFDIAVLLPGLAVGARRLHDIGKSGWWQLLWLVPFVGPIVVIVWWCKEGDGLANRYVPAVLTPAPGAI